MGKKGFNAEFHLLKHGWTKGSGLGTKGDGIKEAIKVKLKFDQTGVGHNPGDEFTFHWWDHAFNKAASKIKVNTTKDGIQIETNTNMEDSISTKKTVITDKKKMLYGTFVKSSAVTSEGEMKRDQFKDSGFSSDSSSDSDIDEADAGSLSKLTDEQLLKICEGRTAHKGARHGLKLSGKLARIAAQENQYEACAAAVVSMPSAKHHAEVESPVAMSSDLKSQMGYIKEKHRKVRLDHRENNNNKSGTEHHLKNDTVITKSKKKSKHKSKGIVNNTNFKSEDDNSFAQKKKKKKKRSKCRGEDRSNEIENDACLSELTPLQMKKSKLKKVASDVSTSDDVFIELPAVNKQLNDDSVKEKSFTLKRQINGDNSEVFSKKKKGRAKRVV